MIKRNKKKEKPVVSPGNAEEYLQKEASPREKKRGDYTRVTKLSWDEAEE